VLELSMWLVDGEASITAGETHAAKNPCGWEIRGNSVVPAVQLPAVDAAVAQLIERRRDVLSSVEIA